LLWNEIIGLIEIFIDIKIKIIIKLLIECQSKRKLIRSWVNSCVSIDEIYVFASDVDVGDVVDVADFGELFASGDFEGLFVSGDIFKDWEELIFWRLAVDRVCGDFCRIYAIYCSSLIGPLLSIKLFFRN
jgi:hypothetical protein